MRAGKILDLGRINGFSPLLELLFDGIEQGGLANLAGTDDKEILIGVQEAIQLAAAAKETPATGGLVGLIGIEEDGPEILLVELAANGGDEGRGARMLGKIPAPRQSVLVDEEYVLAVKTE